MTFYKDFGQKGILIMTKSSAFLEYMKLHLISLEQDSERVQEEMSHFEYNMDSSEYETLEIEDISLNGQIIATRHLLSVATDIMNESNERIYE
jgi:hypothetical protein